MTTVDQLAEQLAAESARLEVELKEIELLVAQARTEAVRHESRRAAAADKLASMGSSTSAREAIDLANQTVTLTRRAALMDAQVEILDAKRKGVIRLKETLEEQAARFRATDDEADGEPDEGGDEGAAGAGAGATDDEAAGWAGGRRGRGRAGDDGVASPAVSRIILTAQEDLRREIARAMHDGPAQSLTNIVLQAEIVERLVGRDPTAAELEVRQLVAMVQQTLEATKAFIFDVRPMVLDDLGLVPTLRRAARDRGRRAGIAVEFESLGMDRRLPVELESGLFRILDEALGGYLALRPDRASLRLDWSEDLVIELAAGRSVAEVAGPDLPPDDAKLPPALAEMVQQRRADHAKAVEEASRAAVVQLPPGLWRDLSGRARSLGIKAELLDEGGRLRLVAPLPSADVAAPSGTAAGSGDAG
ncbi:MAG TPA: histidine kinase [Candidatus Limnocylindrales bacterium]|nr:histidine kinase [Candidatus Limnocylindrales bacterium]